jgi:hypothetical protein
MPMTAKRAIAPEEPGLARSNFIFPDGAAFSLPVDKAAELLEFVSGKKRFDKVTRPDGTIVLERPAEEESAAPENPS